MWFFGKQLPEKSRISKQLPNRFALCLFHCYPTRHGVEYFIWRFSLGRRFWLLRVSISTRSKKKNFPQFQRSRTIIHHWCINNLQPLLRAKVCSNICFQEQLMSREKYPSTFLKSNVGYCVYYLSSIFRNTRGIFKVGEYHSDVGSYSVKWRVLTNRVRVKIFMHMTWKKYCFL